MTRLGRPTPCLACLLLYQICSYARAENAVGIRGEVGCGEVGCGEAPIRVDRLQISKPGVYENYLVDSDWADGNRVKITANNVTLRNAEIRNATGNGVGVLGKNVTIENCTSITSSIPPLKSNMTPMGSQGAGVT